MTAHQLITEARRSLRRSERKVTRAERKREDAKLKRWINESLAYLASGLHEKRK